MADNKVDVPDIREEFPCLQIKPATPPNADLQSERQLRAHFKHVMESTAARIRGSDKQETLGILLSDMGLDVRSNGKRVFAMEVRAVKPRDDKSKESRNKAYVAESYDLFVSEKGRGYPETPFASVRLGDAGLSRTDRGLLHENVTTLLQNQQLIKTEKPDLHMTVSDAEQVLQPEAPAGWWNRSDLLLTKLKQ